MTDSVSHHRPGHRLPVLILAVLALILAACGGSSGDDSGPPPTVANLEALATQRAGQAAAQAITPVTTSVSTPVSTPVTLGADTAAPAPVAASLTPTGAPAASVTRTVTQTPSPSPSATVLSPEQAATQDAATDTVATATVLAGILPYTQTAQAFGSRTPTPTTFALPSPTLAPTLTPSGPVEPYDAVYYTNRNGTNDIYLLAFDGEQRALIAGPADEREPSCSPDGRRVVYASDATGSYQIFLLPVDGTIPLQLTDSAGINFAPVFSPDGTQIAFVSTRNDGIPTIWIMNTDGGNPHQVTTELGRDTSPAWGPDGRQLLFASEQFGPWDLFLTIIEEGIEGEFPVMPPEFNTGNQLWPSFDPAGERIAYSTWGDLDDPQTADMYLLDFEQPQPVAVRASGGADIAWSWADSTHLLASVGGPDDVQIALVDLTSGEAQRLTHAGTFNGGARPCPVPRDILPPEPSPPPSPTPTETPSPTFTPTITPTATPSPTPTQSAFSAELLAAEGHKHIVQPGDTLMSIGYRYGVNWVALADLNTLANPDWLAVGQKLTIPVTRIGRRQGGLQHPDSDIQITMATRKEIVVELDAQIVRAYEDGRLVRTVSVSTGLPGTPTVQGEYSIYYKTESQTMSGPGYYLPAVPYVMYFYKGYGLHGTYWHDNFGHPMSHGCVNLPTPDAKWFYEWAEIGTPVLVKT